MMPSAHAAALSLRPLFPPISFSASRNCLPVFTCAYICFTRSTAEAADRRSGPEADTARVARATGVVHGRRGANQHPGCASPAGFCRRAVEPPLERAVERRFAHEADRTGNCTNKIARMQRRFEPAHGFIEPASAYILRHAAHRFE